MPYGTHLSEALNNMGTACKLSICGLSGHEARQMVAELNAPVVQDIVGNFGKGLARILDEDGPQNLVIIMAGTNDFRPGVQFQSILNDICRLHLACHARDVPTIALVPPCADPETRLSLCKMLRNWTRAVPKVLAVIDPEELVPRSLPSCWEPDQTHMSPAGSQRLGHRLAPKIGSLLRSQSFADSSREFLKRPAPTRTSRRFPKVLHSMSPIRSSGCVRWGGA